MKDIFSNLKTNILCKRTRNKMLSSYLSNQYFGFDKTMHMPLRVLNVKSLEKDIKLLKRN